MKDRMFLKSGIATVVTVFLLAGSPTHAAESIPAVTVLIAYQSVSGNTEKMAQGVAEGAKGVSGTRVVLRRVGEVTTEDLLGSDAVIVGSPVYFGNMSGEVKTFFDNWALKFAFPFQERKMRNKVGAAFATGASFSNSKEVTILTILGAMLINQMIVISGGGGFGASATTGPGL